MKFVLFVFGTLLVVVIVVHTLLQNGTVIKYLDEHPDPQVTPALEYNIGMGYYLFQDLQHSATYFIRVPERFPNSSYADDAFFQYLQAVDDMMTWPHDKLAAEYDKYLERFPHGKHVSTVERRIDHYRNGH